MTSEPSQLGATLDRLWEVIQSRRGADPQSSYTARLFARGRAKIAQKLGEEAVEAVIEGVKENPAALVGESADLLYHLLVLWAASGISPADVALELMRREGTSGIAEKRARANL
jgi:phosphoribosyl-ATP pyrophosphohydrolase